VSCPRSPEPVFLRWKAAEATDDGDIFVRSGPGTVKLSPESADEYTRTRLGRRGRCQLPAGAQGAGFEWRQGADHEAPQLAVQRVFERRWSLCSVRGVTQIRVSCRHEAIGAGGRDRHGVGGVVCRGVFCRPVGWRRKFCGSAEALLGGI
jgi:hypothetical protein